jgi:Molecular chaperone (small heat shock protein)
MTAITRFIPFRSPARFETSASLDDLLRNCGLGPLWKRPEFAADMRVDIIEGEDVFYLQADIPGLGKDDIDVSMEGNHVAISAEASYDKGVLSLTLPKKANGSARKVLGGVPP